MHGKGSSSHRWRGSIRKKKREVAKEILKHVQEEVHELRVLLEKEND